MTRLNIIAALCFGSFTHLTHGGVIIPRQGGPPPGYSVGWSTQDYELAGQQSICTTSCPSSSFLHTAADTGIPGLYAASISAAMGGAPDDCTPCGTCYNIMNGGMLYCNPHRWGPAYEASGPSGKGSPNQPVGAQIKVMIVNHCPNCAPDQFDINNAPPGWDNPTIWYQQTPC